IQAFVVTKGYNFPHLRGCIFSLAQNEPLIVQAFQEAHISDNSSKTELMARVSLAPPWSDLINPPLQCAATLIIIFPLATLSNWEKEIQTHFRPKAIPYLVFHGR
ncbi:uncharacterized protein VP01_10005g1, partial [Puccinia sorghi]